MTRGAATAGTRFSGCTMAKTRSFRRQDRQAFTLLEIMMVVIIIGIMAGLVMPKLAGQSERAKIAQTKNQIDSFKTTLKSYEMHTGKYPSTDEGLMALIEMPGSVDEEEWDGPYLEDTEIVPLDPWNNEYQYVSPGSNNRGFDLWSMGPDEQDGTEDDITSWISSR